MCLTLGTGSDDTDRIVFVRSSRLLVDIVFGSECKAARLEQLMQKGYLRLMFDVLGPTKNMPQAPLEEEGQGECAVADCVAAVLAAFKAALDMSSTASSFAKHMGSPQPLTVFLKLCSSNDEGTEAEAPSLLQSMTHQCGPPSRTASRTAYGAVGGADMVLEGSRGGRFDSLLTVLIFDGFDRSGFDRSGSGGRGEEEEGEEEVGEADPNGLQALVGLQPFSKGRRT